MNATATAQSDAAQRGAAETAPRNGGQGGRTPQHLRALDRANRVRLARAELKRQVEKGEATVAEIVLDNPEEACSMEIADLLLAQHRWGRTRCYRFLATIPLQEKKTVGSLTERQRHAIAAALNGSPVPAAHHFGGRPELAVI